MNPMCDDAEVNAKVNPQTNPPYPACTEEPAILEEIEVEDLAVDGICGVY